MVNYWLLSYPRTNMEITIREKMIGGKTTPSYEKLFKMRIDRGDKIVLYISGVGKIKGSAIAGDYFYDEKEVWPPQDGEVWPHRRDIELECIHDLDQEKTIKNYYLNLDILKKARENNMVIGKVFGNFIRGLTPKRINEHDYLLLVDKLDKEKELALIGATGYEYLERHMKFINDKGRSWQGWTFRIKDIIKNKLEEQINSNSEFNIFFSYDKKKRRFRQYRIYRNCR